MESEDPGQTACYFPVAKDGEVLYVLKVILCDNQRLMDSDVDRIIGIFSNVLLLIQEKDRGFLTGLHNRMYFIKIMTTMDSRAYSHLAMLDIDHFKSVNDTYGHLIGDEVLIHFSGILKNSFRREDFKIRYGGEEFLVIIKETESRAVEELLNRFRKKVEAYNFPGIGNLTVSIGFSTISGTANLYETSSNSDKALYYAKEHGRNIVLFYESLVREGKIEVQVKHKSDITLWD
ncbi:MAG: GGDEF domain-containing protein [Spirochaetales bacterium]|nr:GGDEF domain-containing protein [Spirochaetales bacterium]